MDLRSREAQHLAGLVVNVPEFFQDPAFLGWLNDDTTSVFTWHSAGSEPGEWSDVIVGVDPSLNGEGSDADMPPHLWHALIELCQERLVPSNGPHILVRLTNLDDGSGGEM